MNWYGIKLLFRAEHAGESDQQALYQESVLLVNAADEGAAKTKAVNWSASEEVSYKNIYNEEIKWQFINIVDIYQLPEKEIGDCCEVYSSLFYGGKGARKVPSLDARHALRSPSKTRPSRGKSIPAYKEASGIFRAIVIKH